MKLANVMGWLGCLVWLAACSPTPDARSGPGGEGASSGNGAGGSSGGPVNLGGSVSIGGGLGASECPSGQKTTLSGAVFDPAGKVPLYNVVVYVPVPGEALPPIAEGASCDKCAGSTARGVAVALSDASGRFVLEDVPAGNDVPLVIQVGKWRREVTIPSVRACQDNPIDDPNLTRLPRTRAEGHIPRIAISTGHSDALECLLRKIGIDDQEFGVEGAESRVHLFSGCATQEGVYGANRLSPALGGATFPRATTLWADAAKLDRYDIVLLSCEGHSCADEKTQEYTDNLKAYGDKGGRIFLDHMHFYWLNHSDNAWEQAADVAGVGDDLASPFTTRIDTSFPKGNALADWLVNVQASTTRGELSIVEGQYSIRGTYAPMSQRWIYTDDRITINGEATGEPAVQYMTINTPVELAESDPDNQCGRIVYTDLHVTAGPGADFSDQGTPFPGGCVKTDLSPQEKALEFMLFDLSSCIQKETVTPVPPTVVR